MIVLLIQLLKYSSTVGASVENPIFPVLLLWCGGVLFFLPVADPLTFFRKDKLLCAYVAGFRVAHPCVSTVSACWTGRICIFVHLPDVTHMFHVIQYLFQAFRTDIQFYCRLPKGKFINVQMCQYLSDHGLPVSCHLCQNHLSISGKLTVITGPGRSQDGCHLLLTSP